MHGQFAWLAASERRAADCPAVQINEGSAAGIWNQRWQKAKGMATWQAVNPSPPTCTVGGPAMDPASTGTVRLAPY